MLNTKLLRQGFNLWRNGNNMISRSYKVKFKDGGDYPTFNDCPVPEGSWHEAHARKQFKYNLVLAGGLLANIACIALVATTGMINFNFFVPDYPYLDDDDEETESTEEPNSPPNAKK